MSSNIDNIFADISIFDDLFCDVILKEMESQKIFWTGNDIIPYPVTPLSGLAANILATLSTWK